MQAVMTGKVQAESQLKTESQSVSSRTGTEPMEFDGWLIGIDIDGDKAILTFKPSSPNPGNTNGRNIKVIDNYRPYFYAVCFDEDDPERDTTDGKGADYIENAMGIISQHPHVTDARIEDKHISLNNSGRKPAIRVAVDSTRHFRSVVSDMRKVPQVKETAETGLAHYFRYEMSRGLCYFRNYSVKTNSTGRLDYIEKSENIMGTPQLNAAAACFRGKEADVLFKGRVYSGIMPESLAAFAELYGIDVLFSCGGDEYLKSVAGYSSSSNSSCGIANTPIGCFIRGCIHIDVRRDIRNDIYNETGAPDERVLDEIMEAGKERLLRVIELSSMTGAKPELVSRVSPGKLNTCLHIASAKEKGYIVPDAKKGMEEPKSLRLLGLMDRGGLIFYPEPGVYENVAKCDFSSMYPSIIVRYNISPETLNCECCTGPDDTDRIEVPETDWHICGKRKGIIPRGISNILIRRSKLKRMKRKEKNKEKKFIHDIHQRAMKNLLVVSFGYLGFKNFIFSKVECKECVMLFGRHILLRTKQIAEEMGLEVVYGITDSVFVRNGDDATYRAFVDAVSKEIGIELELDCMFDAIAFPAAADGDGISMGIANKYYGLKRDTEENLRLGKGHKQRRQEIEARGIALRHSDCPQMIAEFQEKVVYALLGDGRMSGNGMKNAAMIRDAYKYMLQKSRFPLGSLAITKRLRRPVELYSANAPHVVAYRHLLASRTDSNNDNDSQSAHCSHSSISGRIAQGAAAILHHISHGKVTYIWTNDGPMPLEHVSAGRSGISILKYSELLDAALEELTRGIDHFYRLDKVVGPERGIDHFYRLDKVVGPERGIEQYYDLKCGGEEYANIANG